MVVVILLLDQLVWRPLTTWSEKFKLQMVEGEEPMTSWFLDSFSHAWLVKQFGSRVWRPFIEWVDGYLQRQLGSHIAVPEHTSHKGRPSGVAIAFTLSFALLVSYGGYRAAGVLVKLPSSAWAELGIGGGDTFLRVSGSLLIALLWTIPLGVAIGTNRRLATVLQPVVQVVAAIPATALFPVVLLVLLQAPGGLNLAAVALMLMGTQWYLLFNVIAGAAAIPQDLRDTAELLRLSRVDRWRTLILPALFPYIVTGAITASGGAWNASIIAEHVEFGGDYPLLLAATLALVITVILINRTFWLRLYRLAEARYHME